VLRAFEDMGYYCVDNLPVELIPIFAELHAAGQGDFARAALLVDAREGLHLDILDDPWAMALCPSSSIASKSPPWQVVTPPIRVR
jgi:RNase adaptor protein for sRNA GlmZ degradation